MLSCDSSYYPWYVPYIMCMFCFQLLLSQRAGLEWHEELETVSVQAGLKGKKLSKVRPVTEIQKVQNTFGLSSIWTVEQFIIVTWLWLKHMSRYVRKHNFGHVSSEDSDQLAQMCKLIWIFTGHILDSQWCKVFFIPTTKTDQTVSMCRLVWVFVWHI